ncbi:hypothetical protein F8388_026328 [Cannabis sativa]|uniref:Glucose-methanol-choline oxidoreductase C-terminal domain-containing protein n=1 Tax=Cannabis sativa TaxID=3483 RepID=A0A7J6FBN0_CANSA|nr:hypothetical protein F8388_026328 [Cannabis sativa]KAF4368111.1 hypothetical protein G4B88_001015 [Cannabis sativa]
MVLTMCWMTLSRRGDEVQPRWYPSNKWCGCGDVESSTVHLGMAEKLRQPLSSGSLWLASPNNVRVTPHVRFNYFSHPKDLFQCVSGVRKISEMLKTSTLWAFLLHHLTFKNFIPLGTEISSLYQHK